MGGGASLLCSLPLGEWKLRDPGAGAERCLWALAWPNPRDLGLFGIIWDYLNLPSRSLRSRSRLFPGAGVGITLPSPACLHFPFFHSATSRVNRRAKLRSTWGVSGKVKMKKAGSAGQGGRGEVMELWSCPACSGSPRVISGVSFGGYFWAFPCFESQWNLLLQWPREGAALHCWLRPILGFLFCL